MDWGADGLFVGMIVGCKKVTSVISGEDGTKRSRLAWKIMYADEDFESGAFLNKRTCLRLDDDGVKRPVMWFEGDNRPLVSQKQYSTPVAQQSTAATIDPKVKPHSISAPPRGGQVLGESGSHPKEHGEHLSSLHSVHNVHNAVTSSPEGQVSAIVDGKPSGRKHSSGRQEQKGLKRTNMGDEKQTIDGAAQSEAKEKTRVMANGDAEASEPCGPDDGSLPLKKRASSRCFIVNFTQQSITDMCNPY